MVPCRRQMVLAMEPGRHSKKAEVPAGPKRWALAEETAYLDAAVTWYSFWAVAQYDCRHFGAYYRAK